MQTTTKTDKGKFSFFSSYNKHDVVSWKSESFEAYWDKDENGNPIEAVAIKGISPKNKNYWRKIQNIEGEELS